MIINTAQCDVEVTGDIEERRISIDPKDIEFVVTLLSSNLYSDPEASFMREITSNAWDSHVEAGTTDKAVIIQFRKGSDGHSVSVRDYGTGLSPQRFKDIFCNIGSSTKRDSNEYIGGFGIGRFSALACSDTVHVTSFYEGTAYGYMMMKSGNRISVSLLYKAPTSEDNGVEVRINGIKNITPYEAAVRSLVFFPNVYVDGTDAKNFINGVKIRRFKNFAASSLPVYKRRVLLGNVLYNIDSYKFTYDVRSFLHDIEDSSVVLRFDTGEIDITPNREEIIYTSSTVRKIAERALAAKAELDELVRKKTDRDYDDIFEYRNAICKHINYDPVTDEIVPYDSKRYYTDLASSKATFKGIRLVPHRDTIDRIFNMMTPGSRGVLYNDKVYSVNAAFYHVRRHMTIENMERGVILKNASIQNEAVKGYLKSCFKDDTVILSETAVEDYVSMLENDAPYGVDKMRKEFPDAVKEIAESLFLNVMRKCTVLDAKTDQDFLDYKKSVSKKTVKTYNRNVMLHVWRDGWKEKIEFSSLDNAVRFLKEYHRRIVLARCSCNDSYNLGRAGEIRGFSFVQVNESLYKALMGMNLPFLYEADWVMSKDKKLSEIKTLIKFGCSREMMTNPLFMTMRFYLNKEDLKEYQYLMKLKPYLLSPAYADICEHADVPNDRYVEYLCNKYTAYYRKLETVRDIFADSCIFLEDVSEGINVRMAGYVIMKMKAFRISWALYEKIRKDKLLNILRK